jgi:hypothetical protein
VVQYFQRGIQAIYECYGKKQCFFKEQIEMAVILKKPATADLFFGKQKIKKN